MTVYELVRSLQQAQKEASKSPTWPGGANFPVRVPYGLSGWRNITGARLVEVDGEVCVMLEVGRPGEAKQDEEGGDERVRCGVEDCQYSVGKGDEEFLLTHRQRMNHWK